MPVSRANALLICIVCALLAGCNGEAGPIEKVATAPARFEEDAGTIPEQTEPGIDGDSHAAETKRGGAREDDSAAGEGERLIAVELREVRFEVPTDWKKVPPQNNIVEAEFELPRAEGDEYDGRLTLMSAGGEPEQAIATRKAEFNLEPGEPPKQEKVEVAGVEATLVDLRGEWKGISGQKMAPRPGYRMLLLIIPLPRGTFYVKLTAPRATLAARENEFRTFLRSLRAMQ